MSRRSGKRRALEAIKRILLRESLNQPLIVIFEDLHWIDDESQEFLNLLADSIGTRENPAAGELSARVLASVEQQDLLHPAPARPARKESAEEMLTALLATAWNWLR